MKTSIIQPHIIIIFNSYLCMVRIKMLVLINGKNNYLNALEENHMYDAIAVSFHWSS